MTQTVAAEKFSLSRYRLTRFRVMAICGLLLTIVLGVSFVEYSNAKNLILPSGGVIGGDYIAFDVAAGAAADGEAQSAYDVATFESLLHEHGPPRDKYGLTWQYPPTYFLLIAPLAGLGFIAGYILWTGGTMAAFFAVMRLSGFQGIFLLVILAAPSTFHAVITGQNGFLTATLLLVASLFPGKRPILAGIAAALLTMKPQLGLLLPVAYLAGGCYRAFFVAAAGAIALAAVSVGVFGPEIWGAFLNGLDAASANVTSKIAPLYKMATPFSAALLGGAPLKIAMAFQILCAIAAAAVVAVVWRRVRDTELRAAALLACVFFTAPYAYYYELIILAAPLAILAKRGLERGWIQYEQILICFAFVTPLFLPADAKRLGFSLGFFVVIFVATAVLRRIAREEPETFRFASVKPRPQSG